MAVQTAIEFAHRADAAVETLLILSLAVVALYVYRRREIRILAPIMVAFLFMQAGLGAWAVMAPQLSAVLALHFGVSLIAFASVLLTAVFVFEVDGVDRLRDRPVPQPFRLLVWSVTAYSYIVVYLGALVRHIDADEACSGWPLCNGRLIPTFSGDVAINFVHRVAAFVLILAVAIIVYRSRALRADRPDLYRGAWAALITVLLQALAGAAVVWTRLDLFSALAHAALVGLMFGALAYQCLHVLPRPRQDVQRARAIAPGTEQPGQALASPVGQGQRDPAAASQ
jgi:cytochrome c oxidase assembly protein subunit 15